MFRTDVQYVKKVSITSRTWQEDSNRVITQKLVTVLCEDGQHHTFALHSYDPYVLDCLGEDNA